MSTALLAEPASAKHSAPNNTADKKAWTDEIHTPAAGEYSGNVPIADIVPDPHNRKDFDADELQSLTDQIKAEGLLQPIVIRPMPKIAGARASGSVVFPGERDMWHVWREVEFNDGKVVSNPPLHGPCSKKEAESVAAIYRSGLGYQIIAGERRYLACKKLGWLTMPAMIRKSETDLSAARKQAIENDGREDLNPIERARNYARLITLGDKQKDLMELFKLSQPVISNTLRLLELPEFVQGMIVKNQLTHAHGVALARWAKWKKLCTRIADLAYSHNYDAKSLGGGLIFEGQLEQENLIKRIRIENGYSWDESRPTYVMPAALQKDPDFAKIGGYWWYFLPDDPTSPNKWQPEMERQDSARAAKQAAAEKKAAKSNVDGKKTPEQKARAKKIADNKAARGAINAGLDQVVSRLKSMKGIDGASLALIAQKACPGESPEEAAEMLGIKVPKGFDDYDPASWAKLAPADAVRIAAITIAIARAHEANRYASDVPEEIEFLRKGGKAK